MQGSWIYNFLMYYIDSWRTIDNHTTKPEVLSDIQTKNCVDCRFHELVSIRGHMCRALIDVVTGKPGFEYAEFARLEGGACEDGKLFEPKLQSQATW